MGVQDNFPVSAAYTNPRFISKNTPDVMPFPLGFTGSGAAIADIQAAVNKLYDATGASESATGTVYDATAGTVSNGDTYEECITILANKFDAATGHKHTGAAGDAPVLDVVLTAAVAGTGGTPVFGDITFEAGTGMTINQVGDNFIFSSAAGTTIAASGYTQLSGDVVLVAGTGGISITQSGQNIIFEAGGGGGGGGSMTIDTFSGDGSDVTFTLSEDPGTEANTWVFVSGVYQEKGTYSVSGTTLTFSTAPPLGTDNIEVVIGGVTANIPSDGSVTRAKFDLPGAFLAPLVTTYTSGTGTHTITGSPLYMRVRMVGGGGGASGSGAASAGNGTDGGTSYFRVGASPDLLVANGGAGGAFIGNGGIGGTASLGSGPVGTAVSGATGQGGSACAGGNFEMAGGNGGGSPFGGAGAGAYSGTGNNSAVANTGSGGGGGSGTNATVLNWSGSGGGAGGFIDAIITSPNSTYNYAVGTAGSGGAAGTAGSGGSGGYTGGNGAAGYIEVTEYYQ